MVEGFLTGGMVSCARGVDWASVPEGQDQGFALYLAKVIDQS